MTLRIVAASLIAAAALSAVPAAAQTHGGGAEHSGHAQHAHTHDRAKAPETAHCAMGHLPPEQCPPADRTRTEHVDHGDHSERHDQADSGVTVSLAMQGLRIVLPPPAGEDRAEPVKPAVDHSTHARHAGHAMPPPASASTIPVSSTPPPRAFEGPAHAADLIWGEDVMAPSRRQLEQENGDLATGMLMIERLEARLPTAGGDALYLWDAQGWYGGDRNRAFFKTEGEGAFGGALESAEVQALYSRAIAPFFDMQAGVRLDIEPVTRPSLAVGIQGLAPYMFHVDAAAFLSSRGDLTARIEGEYDQKITQRLIVQPRAEIELAAQDIPEFGTGAGLSKLETGVRVRYELAREFAPYIGLGYEAKLGRSADFARAEGEDPDGLFLLLGVRAWF